ncbi:MAG TPA: ABC transporter ATP-binding protein [Acidimicrobiia bacterium]|nr:ABC transporter ATP-binding protein [Acidimicrobiia bacterium]
MAVIGSEPSAAPLLSVENLHVTFHGDEGTVQAVRGVTWELRSGEVLGIVGESGSGKSVSVASILGLLPSPPAVVSGGPITFEGRNLLSLSERELRAIRGKDIAMIFQDPMTAFNPVQTIGHQISEAIRVHDRGVKRAAARDRSIELLSLVGVPSPAARFDQFPHEYSGGMRQRAMVAMAIANQPKLLIADEPTTALDVTIQAQILELLEVVRRETHAATILITHDLGVIAEVADRVLVMYAGKVVESTSILPLFQSPRHPYTLGLLGSLPRLDVNMETLFSIPGQPPDMAHPPPGCAFAPRCSLSRDRSLCRAEEPPLIRVGEAWSACHFVEEMEHEAEVVSHEVGMDIRVGES